MVNDRVSIAPVSDEHEAVAVAFASTHPLAATPDERRRPRKPRHANGNANSTTQPPSQSWLNDGAVKCQRCSPPRALISGPCAGTMRSTAIRWAVAQLARCPERES